MKKDQYSLKVILTHPTKVMLRLQVLPSTVYQNLKRILKRSQANYHSFVCKWSVYFEGSSD